MYLLNCRGFTTNVLRIAAIRRWDVYGKHGLQGKTGAWDMILKACESPDCFNVPVLDASKPRKTRGFGLWASFFSLVMT